MIVVENMYPNGGMRDVTLMKKSCKYFNLFAKKNLNFEYLLSD